MIYNNKYYRDLTATERWKKIQVKFETSDLLICARHIDEDNIKSYLIKIREEIRKEEKYQKVFLTSLTPLEEREQAGEIVSSMYKAAKEAQTGPMAAVAGAVAQFCGQHLMRDNDEVIIENGGDIWCSLQDDSIIGIYPGGLHFTEPIGLKIKKKMTPCGICSSSGVIGKSLSFGKADIAAVIAEDASVADAVATKTCNMVEKENDIEGALTFAMKCKGVKGALIIFKDKLAALGAVELTAL